MCADCTPGQVLGHRLARCREPDCTLRWSPIATPADITAAFERHGHRWRSPRATATPREAAEPEAEAAKLERWAAYAAAHPEEAADTQALIDALHPDGQTPHLGQEPGGHAPQRP